MPPRAGAGRFTHCVIKEAVISGHAPPQPLGPLAIIAVIGCFILAQVLSMASALGGGIALSTMGAGRWASDKAWRGGKWAVPKAGKTAAYPVKKLAPRAWAAVTRRGSVSQG